MRPLGAVTSGPLVLILEFWALLQAMRRFKLVGRGASSAILCFGCPLVLCAVAMARALSLELQFGCCGLDGPVRALWFGHCPAVGAVQFGCCGSGAVNRTVRLS